MYSSKCSKKEKKTPHQGISKKAVDKRNWLDRPPWVRGWNLKNRELAKGWNPWSWRLFPTLTTVWAQLFCRMKASGMGWHCPAGICLHFPKHSNGMQIPGQPNLRKGRGAWWAPAPQRSQQMSHRHPVRSPTRTIYPLISQAGAQKQDLESSWQQLRACSGFPFRNLGVGVVLSRLRREQMRFHQKQARVYLIAESCTGIFTVGPMEGWNR